MRYFPLCVLLTIILSCQNKEPGQKAAASGDVYFDYRVWGEEGREEATLRLQYKVGDDEGEAIAWEPPAKVLFDGEELKADSSRFTGAYYELIRPVEELSGSHRIVFTDVNGKEHRDSFRLEPFSLAGEIPESLRRKSFQLRLANLPDTTMRMHLVMADTSLHSEGVNEELRMENGVINITEQLLSKLTNGPVILEIYSEEERLIGNKTDYRGRFSIRYRLKREFELTD